MSTSGELDSHDAIMTFRRLYKNEVVQHCSVCVGMQLPEDNPADGLEDCLGDVIVAGQQGCSFCALVARSAHRQQRVFGSLPWNQVTRTIQKNGSVGILEHRFGGSPPRNFPLSCGTLDSVDPKDVEPWLNLSYRPESRTDSEDCQSLVQKWILGCVDTHSECKKDSAPDSRFCPSRLLDLQPEPASIDQFALVELTELKSLHGYACLSHCWGNNVLPLRLNQNNQQRLKAGRSRSELPQTFRDAAEICNWLKIRYLWIDSLCILQDSEEDWLYEASQMPNIYRNSFLTIAAARATDSTSGLFSARDPFITSIPYFIQEPAGPREEPPELRAIVDPWLWEEEVELSVWNSRAWVLQERLLSRRVLYCGSDQLLWQCRKNLACETFPERLPPFYFSRYSVAAPGQAVSSLKESSESDGQRYYNILETWGQICETYSKAQLTFLKDRLPAFAGVAEEFSLLTGETYVAGLWLKWIERQLLWMTMDNFTADISQPLRAPTWSWLSIDGAIEWSRRTECRHRMTKLISLEAQSQTAELFFGSHTSYELLLDATIVQGTLEGLSDSEAESTPKEEYHTGSKRVNHEKTQRLRFTAADESFSIVDEGEIWFFFDRAFTVHGRIKCYILSLLFQPGESWWWLHGLVLWDTSVQAADPPRLERIGTFTARNAAACAVASHKSCRGAGCDLRSWETQEEDMKSSAVEEPEPPFINACRSFFDEHKTTKILLV